MGTEMVRPSESSTESVSSVTSTATAVGAGVLRAEEGIPAIQKLFQILFYKFVDPTKLASGKAATALEPDRREPVFRFGVVSLHMNMRRFVPVPSVEEEAVRTATKNRGLPMLRQSKDLSKWVAPQPHGQGARAKAQRLSSSAAALRH
jgi:hypothetical protein